MSTIEDVVADVTELSNTLTQVDLKLDEIAAFIATLQAGVVTQEQLDNLKSLTQSAKDSAAAVLTEADQLDE